MKKYYILTTEVRNNTYTVEANSEDEAHEMFFDSDIWDSADQPVDVDYVSEEIHKVYCEDEVIKL